LEVRVTLYTLPLFEGSGAGSSFLHVLKSRIARDERRSSWMCFMIRWN
jgi:hypothetical protein